jgi:energy-coupling factor transporter ATP-binding protein EcfA2
VADENYTASKTRSNRPGWSITFRHPLRADARGRPGLKIRRGLGTSEADPADAMVAEMNALLSDSSWWNVTRRPEAELKFSKAIVDAFYDEIQAGRTEAVVLREQHIRMPTSSDEKYTRVLLVGTTGAGKTTLLRQLIGTDPDADRFPSTAPAKTTISDIEAILSEGEFEAAITFFTEFQVQANIEECISDACLASLEGLSLHTIADRLLNHRDQRFRLSYILGSWRDAGSTESESDLSFDETVVSDAVFDEESLTDAERLENRRVLESYISGIGAITESAHQGMLEALGIDLIATKGADLEAARQLIEENFDLYLQKEDGFHDLAQDILDNVRARFDRVQSGELQRRRSGWPDLWTFKSNDRSEFIRQIRWFSSNYWPQFGRLLTPLVDGIRVKGPLFPTFTDSRPKLVLIDGQGLGHTPDSSASVTTHITRRFESVDVILLVDNATQPMQAASLAVLRAVAAGGHHEKLAIAFTRFDQINGKNLPTLSDKNAHVMASVRGALTGIRDSLGAPVVRAIEHSINSRCFMLGGVDRQLSRLPARAGEYMRRQLQSLVEFFESAILPPPPPEAHPIYDPTGLSFAVQEAVNKFQGPWLARLGLGSYEGIGTAHWATIKALNRRIAGGLDVEYGNLQPVADLIARLSESISRFLDRPLGWNREPSDQQEEQSAIAEVRRAVSIAIHDLAMRRIIEDHLSEWRAAYDGPEYSGKGSTFLRARTIHGIYDAAAPLPDAVMTSASMAFLTEVRGIVTRAVEFTGGTLRLGEAA